MPFLPPNQQRQSTDVSELCNKNNSLKKRLMTSILEHTNCDPNLAAVWPSSELTESRPFKVKSEYNFKSVFGHAQCFTFEMSNCSLALIAFLRRSGTSNLLLAACG